METRGSTDPATEPEADVAGRLHWILLAILQAIMLVELVLLLRGNQWRTALQVLIIMGLTLAPVVLKSRLPVRVPAEFQILAILFVFSSLFLGEVRNYYELIWWWDAGLHASSGLLFGIVGFLLVYVLNENERIDISLRPRFVALFAFTFAMSVGALWEVFEFAMDQTFGLQMQKPRLGDPSGLTDTMWDLSFDAIGAVLISAFAWWYMIRDERSFVEHGYASSTPITGGSSAVAAHRGASTACPNNLTGNSSFLATSARRNWTLVQFPRSPPLARDRFWGNRHALEQRARWALSLSHL